MSTLQSTDQAWEELVEYARQPDATITTAQRNSENEIGVDSPDQIYFRKDGGRKRRVSRAEFNQIWQKLQTVGEITRKQVGEITSDWSGAALFGALDDVFGFEVDSLSPLRLQNDM